MREHIDEIREAFPRFEWKQYGSFLVASTDSWILSVAVTFPEHGYLASISKTSSTMRLPPAASYKACAIAAIAAIKDVLEQTQQNIRFRANQLNKLSEELQ